MKEKSTSSAEKGGPLSYDDIAERNLSRPGSKVVSSIERRTIISRKAGSGAHGPREREVRSVGIMLRSRLTSIPWRWVS